MFQSMPILAIDNKKQFQCQNILLNNKTEPPFLESNWYEGTV